MDHLWLAVIVFPHLGDPSQQQAEYLLDPVAYRMIRTWQERESSMAYRIINGDEVFADHATSGQGFRWRCSTRTFLTAAVARIDAEHCRLVVARGFDVIVNLY